MMILGRRQSEDVYKRQQQGRVSVNGEVDTRRGRKLYAGDVAEYNGEQIKIEK